MPIISYPLTSVENIEALLSLMTGINFFVLFLPKRKI